MYVEPNFSSSSSEMTVSPFKSIQFVCIFPLLLCFQIIQCWGWHFLCKIWQNLFWRSRPPLVRQSFWNYVTWFQSHLLHWKWTEK